MSVPIITALPMPPARTEAPREFTAKMDVFVSALPAFGAEANALAAFLDERASSVESIATELGENVALAQQAADAAAQSKDKAGTSQKAAAASELAAAGHEQSTGESRQAAERSASSAAQDRIEAQRSASSAANCADHAAVSAGTAATYAELSGAKVYTTKALADADLAALVDGQPVRIVADENFSGRSAWYVMRLDAGASLSLDFAGNTYGVGALVLAKAQPEQAEIVAVPANATAPGKRGNIAVDANYLYVATGANQWKRAALVEW